MAAAGHRVRDRCAARRGGGGDGPARVPAQRSAQLPRHPWRRSRMRGRGRRGDAAVSEEVHPQAGRLDALSTREVLELMQREDRRAVDAVAEHLDEIAAAVDAIASRLRAGGTLHYFGAGTSGRLAELDAIELGPTFGVDSVRAHAAGDGAAEDDGDKGGSDARAAELR